MDKEFGMHLYDEVSAEPELLEDLDYIVSDGIKDFRTAGKRRFSSRRESCSVQIGGRRMNRSELGIVRGVMHIPG